MSTPTISQIDVIKGALAVAGSIFNFLKINGNDIPITLPTTTISAIVNETTIAMSNPPRINPTVETAKAIVKPIAADTTISFVNILNQSLIFTSPTAIARITNVAD